MQRSPLVVQRAHAWLLVLVIGTAATPSRAQPRRELSAWRNEAPRVQAARRRHEGELRRRFSDLGLLYPPGQVHLRAFKAEAEIEIWVGRDGRHPLTRLETIPICARSGRLGPKRSEGDRQVPEGVYRVVRFNPMSDYHLSLGLDYPNQSDKIRGQWPFGGDIFIHGGCVTIGCLPIENDAIERLYVLGLDNQRASMVPISVHIFPGRQLLGPDSAFTALLEHAADDETRRLWQELATIGQAFAAAHIVPTVRMTSDGRYVVSCGVVTNARCRPARRPRAPTTASHSTGT